MIWTALSLGCSPAEPQLLPVAVDGCDVVEVGPVCRRYEASRPIAVWVEGSEVPKVTVDGHVAVPAAWSPSADGVLARVDCAAAECAIRIQRDDGVFSFRLATRGSPVPPPGPQRAAAIRARMASETSSEWFGLAWEEFSLEDSTHDYQGFEAAAAARGQLWWAARGALRQAHQAESVDKDPAAVFAALGRARAYQDQLEASAHFTLAHGIDYYEALGRQDAGDHRRALEVFERAERRALRLGRTDKYEILREHRAHTLIRAGRDREALQILEEELHAAMKDTNPCRKSAGLNHLAWGVLQLRDANGDGLDLPDPVPLLDEALPLLRAGDCGVRYDLAQFEAQTRVNRSLAALAVGDLARARSELSAARRAKPDLQEPWLDEIEARLALREGDPQRALTLFAAIGERPGKPLEFRWMAELGTADALRDLGRTEDAIGALARAQATFFHEGRLIPLQLGQAAFYRQRERATQELGQLLVAQGRPREAFDAFRNQRAQYTSGLQQRALTNGRSEVAPGWTDRLAAFYRMQREAAELRAADRSVAEEGAVLAQIAALERHAVAILDEAYADLGLRMSSVRRRPQSGELFLGWFLVDSGWIGFAEDVATVEVAHWEGSAVPPSAALLAPFASKVARAQRITLFPSGSLTSADLHAAPTAAGPLISQIPVAYGVDLAPSERPQGHFRRALVVADPNGDLSAAAVSAAATSRTLEALGWTVRTLTGSSVTFEALTTALGDVELFDYSGHGDADRGWGSALALADGGELSIADIVTLPRAPEIVVLNACETAREVDEGSLGLGQAFAAAGSRWVIATARPVGDTVAASFSALLFRELRDPQSVPDAYRHAMASLAEAEPGSDWPTFQMITP